MKMTKIHYIKAAAVAATLLGSATLAVPSQAATLTAAEKSILSSIAASPTPGEKAITALLEQVTPGSTQTLVQMVKSSADVAALATKVEAYTALNPSLMAVIENAMAAFAADARLAPLVAATDCSADAASLHTLVQIWCGLPSGDPYPVMP
jgi:hypothetical protein